VPVADDKSRMAKVSTGSGWHRALTSERGIVASAILVSPREPVLAMFVSRIVRSYKRLKSLAKAGRDKPGPDDSV
jgi:hypothetical protein